MDIIQTLNKLVIALENKGYDDLAARIPSLRREINAAPAKGEGVVITDWDSFLTWWGENRGQNLKYVFTDTFGAESEEVQKVTSLLEEADAHEKNLHDFYMLVKKKAKQQQTEPATKEEGEEKQVLEPKDEGLELKPEPDADLGDSEEEGDDLEDLGDLEDLDEEDEEKGKKDAFVKTSAFMEVEVFKGNMIVGEDASGETFMYPAKYFSKEDVKREVGKIRSIGVKNGWWGRYSAPGYMDATDWAGPFASEQACRLYLDDMYGDDEPIEGKDASTKTAEPSTEHTGYEADKSAAKPGSRIELHPGMDLWMRGARFGDIVKLLPDGSAKIKLDAYKKIIKVKAKNYRLI